KTPKAAAVWRQGNLLHFGFEPSPERLTDAGQALLVNSIAYIARFTEDRPVVRAPAGRRCFDRGVVARLTADPSRDLKDLQYYLSKATYAPLAGKSREEVVAWYEPLRNYLHADGEGRLAVDEEARSFGASPSGPEFFDKALAALDDPARATVARRLLGR